MEMIGVICGIDIIDGLLKWEDLRRVSSFSRIISVMGCEYFQSHCILDREAFIVCWVLSFNHLGKTLRRLSKSFKFECVLLIRNQRGDFHGSLRNRLLLFQILLCRCSESVYQNICLMGICLKISKDFVIRSIFGVLLRERRYISHPLLGMTRNK